MSDGIVREKLDCATMVCRVFWIFKDDYHENSAHEKLGINKVKPNLCLLAQQDP